MSPAGAASTRWCPTPEQVMILEEMYRSGVRTPNATQIQQITSHLSLYGKIEGKNIFYWFQNHKARDRQKLRKKLLGKQLQQHIMFSHHHTFYPPFDTPIHHQHFRNNDFLSHHPPLPCCGPTPPSLGLFHQLPDLNFPCFCHQAQAEGIAPPILKNINTWKMDTSSSAKYGRENTKTTIMSMITNDYDDCMMMRSEDHNHDDDYDHDDSTRRSIKTLELFPIKDKTSLKDDLSFV